MGSYNNPTHPKSHGYARAFWIEQDWEDQWLSDTEFDHDNHQMECKYRFLNIEDLLRKNGYDVLSDYHDRKIYENYYDISDRVRIIAVNGLYNVCMGYAYGGEPVIYLISKDENERFNTGLHNLGCANHTKCYEKLKRIFRQYYDICINAGPWQSQTLERIKE